MHIILTGGGTAGHVTPNIALIEELKDKCPDIKLSYIGSKKGLEKDLILAEEGVDYYSISSGKLRRYFSWQNFTDIFKVIGGIWQSYFLVRKLNPDLIFSKGGYVSLPVLIAAWFRGVPLLIHESDASPGLTTKISSKFTKNRWSTYPIEGFKQVDLPIRKFLYNGDSKKYKLDTKPSLLVMGGSQGADAINKFIAENIDNLSQNYYILHVTGKGKSLNLDSQDNYLGFEYVSQELADLYASADFILCRSGASTLAELKALNKKTILVPLPTSQSRGDQEINAGIFAKEANGVVLPQSELNLANFEKAISELKSKNLEIDNKKSSVVDLLLKAIQA
jgi:UDP-N-acetylglucosamine--N-acetylmuramyl-(pentapeptide) pyrophosphoryl-undecaprenol N-acetylglucosamine transferase